MSVRSPWPRPPRRLVIPKPPVRWPPWSRVPPVGENIDLRKPGLRIHVVGIGGAGMSAIATVLTALGHHVTGSDLKASSALDRLRTMHIDVHVGHGAEHVGDADVVTFSTAIPASNPELETARQRGLPLLRRAVMLAAITATRRTVAVA